PEIPVQCGGVPSGRVRVTRDEVVDGGKARRGGHTADLLAQCLPFGVGDQQGDVGERVTERGHLPVQYGGDGVVVGDEEVVEPVVPVHDRGLRGRRQSDPQSLPELVDPRDVAAAGGVELFAPSPQLSFQEAFGSAEVGEPHRDVVDGVQFGQGVDHRLGDAACPFGAQRDELVPMPVGGAFDVVHHIEGCAEHGGVVAQQHGGRYGDRGGGEGADDGV